MGKKEKENAKDKTPFAKGAKVTVIGGPLDGETGTVEESFDANRVDVRVGDEVVSLRPGVDCEEA